MEQTKRLHTTNYFNTLIEVADDCKVIAGQIPVIKNLRKTIAFIQYELISQKPYSYTSDDVLFYIYADKNNLLTSIYKETRQRFFSKGQPCFRTSPLVKTHGFGVHFDASGKMALYGMETERYRQLAADPEIQKVKAMRSSKKQ